MSTLHRPANVDDPAAARAIVAALADVAAALPVVIPLHPRGRESLRRAGVDLPEELRFTLTARFWGELPGAEIARQEGITPAAIRKRLKRAYALLEMSLGEKLYEELS